MMEMKELDSYFREAGEWGEDRYESIRVSRNRYFVLAGLSLCIALAAVVAVSALAPLKTVENHILEVNQTTGKISELKKLEDTHFALDKAVTEHFVARFLQLCEGYDPKNKDENFYECQILTSGDAQKNYVEYMTKSKHSPFKTMVHNTRSVFVVSMIPTSDRTAQVRYTTTDHVANQTDVVFHWVALFEYKWGEVPQEPEYRHKNMAGFRVNSFKKDQELIKERNI